MSDAVPEGRYTTSIETLKLSRNLTDGLVQRSRYVEKALQDASLEIFRLEKAHEKEVEKLRETIRRLRWPLRELRAMVQGECPGILDEDSGGNSELDLHIIEVLAETADV